MRHVPEDVRPGLSRSYCWSKAGWRRLSGEIRCLWGGCSLFCGYFFSWYILRQQSRTAAIAEENWEISFLTGKQSCHRRFLLRCQHLKNCLGFVSVALINVFLCLRIWTCRIHIACKQTWALSWDQLCRFLEGAGKVVFILFSSDYSSGKHANVWKEIPKQQPSCYLQPTANKTGKIVFIVNKHSLSHFLTPRTRRLTCASTPTLTTWWGCWWKD